LPEFQRENPASKAELQMENTELKRQLQRSKARMQSKIMRMQSKIMRMQSKIMQLERQNSELRRAVLRSESRSMFSLFFKTLIVSIPAITIVLYVSVAPRNMAAALVQPHQGQSGREVVMQRAPSLPQSMPHRCERLWWQIGSAMSRSC